MATSSGKSVVANAPVAARAGRWPRLFQARKGQRSSVLVYILAALLFLLVLPPIYNLIDTSLFVTLRDGSRGAFTFQYFERLYASPRFTRVTLNTTWFAIGSALLAIALGVAQAWIVERTDTPLRRYVFLFSIVSLGVPHVLYTVAWLLILGRMGPLNTFLMWLLGTDQALFNVYSMAGMIFIEAIGWAPLAFLLVSSVFNAADASLEEASAMSGATIARTFRHITLRLASPAVFAVALLITIRAFESFEVAAMIGIPGNIFVLSTDIYDVVLRTIPPNYGLAGSFSVGLSVIVAVMLYLYSRLSRHAARYQTITGKGYRPRPIRLGRWRYLTAATLCGYFLIIIALPICMLAWSSLLPYYQGFSLDAIGSLTLEHYGTIFKSQSVREAAVNTLMLGVGASLVTVMLTTGCAWYSARRYRGAWLLDQLATLPLIFPSIVLGVALLQLYLRLPFPIYGTILSIIVASVISYLPYGMRYAYAGVIQVHTELEEASALSGAGNFATFTRVVVPLIAPALITSALFIFLLASRAVSLPIMLAGADNHVISVTIFERWREGLLSETAALGVAWMAFMTTISSIFYVVARRTGMAIR